ncbi:hypothetical protein ACHAXS_008249 [Conticribra weissflogii]
MSCEASARHGTCASSDSNTLHESLALIAIRFLSHDDGAAAASLSGTNPELVRLISTLVFSTSILFVIAFHYINKEWHLWRDLKLTMEGLLDQVPDISTMVNLPDLSDPDASIDDSHDSGLNSQTTPPKSLVDPANPSLLQCYSPSTLAALTPVPNLSKSQVDSLALRAKHAQQSWKYSTFPQRRRVLRTLQKYVVSHVDQICRLCARDSGKTQVDALLGEILTTCEKIRTLLHHGETWLEPSHREVNPMMVHKTAWVEYVPLGVLGIIAPWNYPFHNMLNHVLSGLFSGNAVVTKCSEHTSWSSVYFHSICRAALEANGFDPDLVQLCTGVAETGKAMVECPHIDKIFFTGSPNVGRHVMAGAAPHLKPVVLELGGKDAMVFCEDVNLEEVFPWAMRGCFQNCGQNCCGVERLFVYESISKDFIKAMVEKVKNLRQGCPLGKDDVDCGAMVMDQQCDLIQALIDDAVAKGAVLHCGGKRNSSENIVKGGQFYQPTLISGVTSEMRIWKEEVFGPIMCVIVVPDDNDDTCVQLVNDCPFGLGSSVYSASKTRALAIGSQFQTGMFTANDFGVNYLIQSLPFGGVKESGFGRFAGPEGLRACCLERSIVIDRIPGVKTSIPRAIDYPMDTNRGMGFGKGLVELFYGDSLFVKIKAVVSLIRYG